MYVVHKVGGDVQGNVRKIQKICRENHTQDVIPFAPYLLALQYLDDEDPEERALGVAANAEFLQRGVVDEIGVFGDRMGRGGFGELKLGVKHGIPIKVYDERVRVDVQYALSAIKMGVPTDYFVVERKLENGNTLLFRKDGTGPRIEDMVLFESETVTDPTTKIDVTRFVPMPSGPWDELQDGWSALEKTCKKLPPAQRAAAKAKFYDVVTRLFYDGTSPQRKLDMALEAMAN